MKQKTSHLNCNLIRSEEGLFLGSYMYSSVFKVTGDFDSKGYKNLQGDLLKAAKEIRKLKLIRGLSRYLIVYAFDEDDKIKDLRAFLSSRESQFNNFAVNYFPVITDEKNKVIWKTGVKNETILLQDKVESLYKKIEGHRPIIT